MTWSSSIRRGLQDLHDSIKTLEAMSTRPMTPQQQDELRQLRQKVQVVTDQMSDLSTRMAEGLKRPRATAVPNGRSASRGWVIC